MYECHLFRRQEDDRLTTGTCKGRVQCCMDDCDILGVEEDWRHLLCRAPPALPPFRDVGLAGFRPSDPVPPVLASPSPARLIIRRYSLRYSQLFSPQGQDLDALCLFETNKSPQKDSPCLITALKRDVLRRLNIPSPHLLAPLPAR